MIVTLRPNIKILNPKEVIIRYYGTMGKGVNAYDKAIIPMDNFFPTEQQREVQHLVNRLGGRGIPNSVMTILSQKEVEIKAKLSKVPASTDILDDYSNIPWEHLSELFNLFRVPYLSLARLTKMLHKKRPNIVPILDRILISYLTPVMDRNTLNGITDGQKGVEYIKELIKDVNSNEETLIQLHGWSGKPYPVSLVRILDILIWSTQGPFRDRFANLVTFD